MPRTRQQKRTGADHPGMKMSALLYGVLRVVCVVCVVSEMVRHQLGRVGWARITPLDVAAALVDTLLVIVLAIAAVVAFDLVRRRWALLLRARQTRQLLHAQPTELAQTELITVASWRPQLGSADSLRTAPVARSCRPPTYAPPTYGARATGYSRRYTEDPGRQL